MTTLFNIDRQSAAKVLSVSVRTIDRYIASGEIRKVKTRGRTWLANDDIKRLLSQAGGAKRDTVASHFFPDVSRDDSESEVVSKLRKDPQIKQKEEVLSDNNNLNYKKLYTEAKEELVNKNKKLQQAIYRIGQLETKIKQMVPQIELQKQQKLLQQSNRNYQELINQETQKREVVTRNLLEKIKQTEHELENEKFNKAIFALLLFLIIFIILITSLVVFI